VSEKLDLATNILARAKDNYQGKLGQIDSLLESAIANNPTELTACRALQATYGTGFNARRLMPNQQPPLTAYDFLQITESLSAALA
jgi:hypothetical protein